MLNIIITAGGTSEKIDNVRKITNSSSGRLGQIIAETFLNQNNKNIEKIYYICPKNALKPQFSEKIQIETIESTEDAFLKMQELLTTKNIDIVVHSMAISDYTVEYATSSYALSTALENKNADEIQEILATITMAIDSHNKISSSMQDLFIKLVPTKKIISYIKKWSPSVKLVGFKLLSGVSENELINVASALLEKNDCDYVIANDIKNINGDNHKAFIIDKKKSITQVNTKHEIAQVIAKKLFYDMDF